MSHPPRPASTGWPVPRRRTDTRRWSDAFANASAAEQFWVLVIEAATRVFGAMASSDHMDGRIELLDGGVMHVHNLAADIQTTPMDDWPDHISWWIGCLLEQSPRRLEAQLDTWSQVKHTLRLRFMSIPEGYQAVGRMIGAGLVWGVAVDLAQVSVPVPVDRLDHWGVTDEQVCVHAQRNTTRRQHASTSLDRTFPASESTQFRVEGNLFVTGVAHDVLTLTDVPAGDAGVLVCPATSHTLFAQPLDAIDDRLVGHIASLLTAAHVCQHSQSHPLPLSVLLWRDVGDLEPLVIQGVTPHDPAFDVVAPEPLRSLLSASPPGHDGGVAA